MELAVAVVLPPNAPSAPTIVMTPSALTVPDATYFVAVKLQDVGRTAEMSATVEDCTTSVTVVRQEDAARITSETFALTV